MNNWIPKTLNDVADIKLSNVDKKTKENERTIRLCNYTDVYKNSFINNDRSQSFMVASCNENEYEKFKLKKGQVAITKDSETPNDIGVPTYISNDFQDVVLGYHLSLITPNTEKLDGRFLYYWLNTKQAKRYFENNAGGSGQRCTLPIDIIKSIPLYLPNIQIQKSIAKVLSDLDSKIELNNKINSELEAMAKTLYDYWFVQFDFPDENGKPYKSSGGKMVYNEELKREIPEGWEVKELNDIIIRSGTGLNPRKNFKLGFGNNYYVTIKNIKQNKVVLDDRCDRIDNDALEIINKRSELKVGDILFTSIQPVGVTYLIQEKPNNWDINESVFTIRPNDEIVSSEFLFMLLSSDEIKVFTKNVSAGSVHKGIRHTVLKTFKLPFGNKLLVENFTEHIKPILKKMFVNEKQSQQLTELRDWLLPMLMNGQVTVG